MLTISVCLLAAPAAQESAGTYAYLRDVACLKVRRAGSWSGGLAGGQGSGARPASASALLLLGYVCRHRCRPSWLRQLISHVSAHLLVISPPG